MDVLEYDKIQTEHTRIKQKFQRITSDTLFNVDIDRYKIFFYFNAKTRE